MFDILYTLYYYLLFFIGHFNLIPGCCDIQMGA